MALERPLLYRRLFTSRLCTQSLGVAITWRGPCDAPKEEGKSLIERRGQLGTSARLLHFKAVAGELTSFVIQKRDEHGKLRARGAEHFYLEVGGQGRWDCSVTDNRDGTFTASYLARRRFDAAHPEGAGDMKRRPGSTL